MVWHFLVWLIGVPIGVIAAIAMVSLMGSVVDNLSRHYEELDRCRKSASTPYDYHRCR